MIFHDLETMRDVGKRVEGLRSKTGADAIVSPKSFPMTDAMIKKHVESGALFYRVLESSEIKNLDRELLLFNLKKMQLLSCSTWQTVLVIDDSHFNNVIRQDYDNFISAVDTWVDHGGTSISTYGNPAEYYFSKREEQIKGDKTRTVLVPKFAPRKEIELLSDWTVTLATFPGIGWQGAQSIRKVIQKLGLGDDLLTALWWLTDHDELEKSDGDMKTVRVQARQWLGLPDGFDLDITVKGKEVVDDGTI